MSIQPRKQRKRLYEAPLHKRQKMMTVNLSKNLRKKFKKRNIPLRKGDKVEILRGEFKGMKSLINKVNLKKLMVTLEDVKRSKTDGTEIRVSIHPTNLRLIEPDMTDRKRQKIVKRVEGEFEVKKPKVEKKEKKEEKKKAGFSCPICGKGFDNKMDLNVHREKEHKDFMER
ncbi:MAG: 50S ribosomal protein L24 [Candidatus Aenigmarchaeota archaeon]|nr:50S ribosomal protein L24 [Candidatus Aenigmarchaeota archaeon]